MQLYPNIQKDYDYFFLRIRMLPILHLKDHHEMTFLLAKSLLFHLDFVNSNQSYKKKHSLVYLQ